jgi:hypothetical protein
MEPAAKDVDPGERLFSQMSSIFIMPEIERRNKGVRVRQASLDEEEARNK